MLLRLENARIESARDCDSISPNCTVLYRAEQKYAKIKSQVIGLEILEILTNINVQNRSL